MNLEVQGRIRQLLNLLDSLVSVVTLNGYPFPASHFEFGS